MIPSSEQLKKISDAFRSLADAIDGLAPQANPVEAYEVSTVEEKKIVEAAPVEVKAEDKAEVKPVEEAFIETAAESEPVAEVAPAPKTVEEARAIVAKALKAGFRSEAKEIVAKYGASVSEIGEKNPGDLTLLFADVEALLEAKNA